MRVADWEERFKVRHKKERKHEPYASFGYFKGSMSANNTFWPGRVILRRDLDCGTFAVIAEDKKNLSDVAIILNIDEWRELAKKIMAMTKGVGMTDTAKAKVPDEALFSGSIHPYPANRPPENEKPVQYTVHHSDGSVGTAFWLYDEANDDWEWTTADVVAWEEME